MSIQMTIVGLGQVGTSFGLALEKYKDQITRTGHDRELNRAKQAQKAGAIDKTQINLPESVERADIVVLAIPFDEIRKTLEVIAPVLPEGCTILDLSANKTMILNWIQELLPAERFYVSMTPSLNPKYLIEQEITTGNAHADLFENSIMTITTPPRAHSDALKLASDLTHLVGAKPYFADPYEVDGLLASSDLLPKLAAAALLHVTSGLPSWREGKKLASRPFAGATEPVAHLDEGEELGQAALANSENTLRALDNYIAMLQDTRDIIAENDAESLKEFLHKAKEVRSEWWQQRTRSEWDAVIEAPQYPTTGEIFGRLLGIRRRGKDKNSK